MSTSEEARKEQPSTYFVQDRENQSEFDRLRVQDQMVTRGMGGVLPEQPDPEKLRRVLDVGCGTGGWLLEVAKEYPTIETLIGVDVSAKMLAYARSQAEEQGVGTRVEFHVMDALRMLEFPTGYFSLVNARFSVSYLRTWDWPKFVSELARVTRRGGVVRLTECGWWKGNSEVLVRLGALAWQAGFNAGHVFVKEDEDSLMERLPELLQRQGIRDIQTRDYELVLPKGTPEGESYREDVRYGFRVLLPFFHKWVGVLNDYEQLYQQMLEETARPDFVGRWRLRTVWGSAPGWQTSEHFV
ncbi:class I SAM-dependent methyltransferase [Ktedonosporobacter rubrisoli]|uniref:Class I SAM-dependent methyltransferase n=1 Tax=Ktedonosporobacter rubrisoli TaxID=2509675 RepID=A0A4P6JWW4_KTERU|nr:class I SAM-dependent methyltransferase [Ktedonosporobacter rubrisoli]QBD79850.1 class I SAM-dependent methyltransferase [Ktedonosporobacter rubrisoli]